MFLNIYIYIYSIQNFKKKNVSHVPQWQPSLPTSTELGKSTEISPFKTSFTSPTCRAKSKFSRPLLVDTKRTKKTWLLERSCIIIILPYTYHICFFHKESYFEFKTRYLMIFLAATLEPGFRRDPTPILGATINWAD